MSGYSRLLNPVSTRAAIAWAWFSDSTPLFPYSYHLVSAWCWYQDWVWVIGPVVGTRGLAATHSLSTLRPDSSASLSRLACSLWLAPDLSLSIRYFACRCFWELLAMLGFAGSSRTTSPLRALRIDHRRASWCRLGFGSVKGRSWARLSCCSISKNSTPMDGQGVASCASSESYLQVHFPKGAPESASSPSNSSKNSARAFLRGQSVSFRSDSLLIPSPECSLGQGKRSLATFPLLGQPFLVLPSRFA